jgi:hypothetical protein
METCGKTRKALVLALIVAFTAIHAAHAQKGQPELHGLPVHLTEIENCLWNKGNLQSSLSPAELENYCSHVRSRVAVQNASVDLVGLDDIMLTLHRQPHNEIESTGRKLKQVPISDPSTILTDSYKTDPDYKNGRDYLCYLGLDGVCYLTSKPAVNLNLPCRQNKIRSVCLCDHDTSTCTSWCDQERQSLDNLGCGSYDLTSACNKKFGAGVGNGSPLPDCIYDKLCTTSQCTQVACNGAGVVCSTTFDPSGR